MIMNNDCARPCSFSTVSPWPSVPSFSRMGGGVGDGARRFVAPNSVAFLNRIT